MAAFHYRAVDANGASERGVIEATNAAQARRMLRDRALLPVSVEASAPGTTQRQWRWPWQRSGIGPRALATLTRQLATLIGSDIRIDEALRLSAAQTTGAGGPLLLSIRSAVQEGRSLAQALSERPESFPEYYRASIAAGEQSGRLPQVLDHLAHFVETRHRTAQKIQLALLYPALLAVVASGMIILLLIYVMPDIVRVFVSHGAALPWLTRMLIGLSDFVQHFGLVVFALLIGLGLWARRWLADSAHRSRADRWLAETPPIARFSRQINAARFASSLATLIQSAVPLVEAIHAAAAVMPNAHLRARALGVARRIGEGTSLQQAMAEAEAFPPMLIAMTASGESSGKLAPAIGRAADELDRELDALVTTLVALVEPAMLLLMGGLVLVMVLAILLPIINLNNLAGL